MSNLALSNGFITTCVSRLDEAGYFAAALTLHKRVMPSPLPASWWVSTHNVIDATSVYLASFALISAALRRVPTYPSGLSDAAHMWLAVAIDMVKMNLEAGLTARDKMNPVFLYQPLGLVEVAARHESQHKMLFDSGVVDALEYTCVNEFVIGGVSLAASAAGAQVPEFSVQNYNVGTERTSGGRGKRRSKGASE